MRVIYELARNSPNPINPENNIMTETEKELLQREIKETAEKCIELAKISPECATYSKKIWDVKMILINYKLGRL